MFVNRYMLSRPLDHSGLVKDMLFSHDLPPEEFARWDAKTSSPYAPWPLFLFA